MNNVDDTIAFNVSENLEEDDDDESIDQPEEIKPSPEPEVPKTIKKRQVKFEMKKEEQLYRFQTAQQMQATFSKPEEPRPIKPLNNEMMKFSLPIPQTFASSSGNNSVKNASPIFNKSSPKNGI